MTPTIELEGQMIGALLYDNSNIDACGVLSADDFHCPIHAEMFKDIREKIAAGASADPVSLCGFGGRMYYEMQDGLLYAADLVCNAPPAADVPAIVEEIVRRRNMPWVPTGVLN